MCICERNNAHQCRNCVPVINNISLNTLLNIDLETSCCKWCPYRKHQKYSKMHNFSSRLNLKKRWILLCKNILFYTQIVLSENDVFNSSACDLDSLHCAVKCFQASMVSTGERQESSFCLNGFCCSIDEEECELACSDSDRVKRAIFNSDNESEACITSCSTLDLCQETSCQSCKHCMAQFMGIQLDNGTKCGTACKTGCFLESGFCKTCEQGYFGVNCSSKCPQNCAHDQCSYKDGSCEYCSSLSQKDQCPISCKIGYYGPFCNNTCSENCRNVVCLSLTGECLLGCMPGFLGPSCDTSCSNGMYGQDCVSNCPVTCLAGSTCDPRNGNCNSGCTSGFHGAFCDDICPKGTHGSSCELLCSDNCVLNECDPFSGQCFRCQPNREGPFCENSSTPLLSAARVEDMPSDNALFEGLEAIIGIVGLGLLIWCLLGAATYLKHSEGLRDLEASKTRSWSWIKSPRAYSKFGWRLGRRRSSSARRRKIASARSVPMEQEQKRTWKSLLTRRPSLKIHSKLKRIFKKRSDAAHISEDSTGDDRNKLPDISTSLEESSKKHTSPASAEEINSSLPSEGPKPRATRNMPLKMRKKTSLSRPVGLDVYAGEMAKIRELMKPSVEKNEPSLGTKQQSVMMQTVGNSQEKLAIESPTARQTSLLREPSSLAAERSSFTLMTTDSWTYESSIDPFFTKIPYHGTRSVYESADESSAGLITRPEDAASSSVNETSHQIEETGASSSENSEESSKSTDTSSETSSSSSFSSADSSSSSLSSSETSAATAVNKTSDSHSISHTNEPTDESGTDIGTTETEKGKNIGLSLDLPVVLEPSDTFILEMPSKEQLTPQWQEGQDSFHSMELPDRSDEAAPRMSFGKRAFGYVKKRLLGTDKKMSSPKRPPSWDDYALEKKLRDYKSTHLARDLPYKNLPTSKQTVDVPTETSISETVSRKEDSGIGDESGSRNAVSSISEKASTSAMSTEISETAISDSSTSVTSAQVSTITSADESSEETVTEMSSTSSASSQETVHRTTAGPSNRKPRQMSEIGTDKSKSNKASVSTETVEVSSSPVTAIGNRIHHGLQRSTTLYQIPESVELSFTNFGTSDHCRGKLYAPRVHHGHISRISSTDAHSLQSSSGRTAHNSSPTSSTMTLKDDHQQTFTNSVYTTETGTFSTAHTPTSKVGTESCYDEESATETEDTSLNVSHPIGEESQSPSVAYYSWTSESSSVISSSSSLFNTMV